MCRGKKQRGEDTLKGRKGVDEDWRVSGREDGREKDWIYSIWILIAVTRGEQDRVDTGGRGGDEVIKMVQALKYLVQQSRVQRKRLRAGLKWNGLASHWPIT